MRTGLKIAGIVASIVGMFFIIFLVIIFSTSPEMCGNQIRQTIVSPDKEKKVLLFARDCGATSGFSTQISLIENGLELANTAGNIFIADDNDGKADIYDIGLIYTEITWVDPKTILIKYDSNSHLHKQESIIKGVKIQYKKIEMPK